MSVHHLNVKMFKRSQGDSAVAAAAYRAGANLRDERQERTHYYARRQDAVAHSDLLLPDEAPPGLDRETLWNAAEARERRKDSQVAREFMIALPHELPQAEQVELAETFAATLVERYGVAADVSVHLPHPERNDARNVHAHILTTRRRFEGELLGDTIEELNPYRGNGRDEVEELHDYWRRLQREAVRRHQRHQEERATALHGSPNRTPARSAERAKALVADVEERQESERPTARTPSPPRNASPPERSEGDRPDRREGRGGRS